jgi:hypothetical protein
MCSFLNSNKWNIRNQDHWATLQKQMDLQGCGCFNLILYNQGLQHIDAKKPCRRYTYAIRCIVVLLGKAYDVVPMRLELYTACTHETQFLFLQVESDSRPTDLAREALLLLRP